MCIRDRTVAAFVHSAFNAALAGWLVRAFDPRARGAVLGLAWNVAAALVGGTAPAFAVLLIEVTGSDVAPGFYISVLAMLAVGGIRALPRAPPAASVCTVNGTDRVWATRTLDPGVTSDNHP